MMKDSNPFWDNICAIAEKQRKKGFDTYGQGIENNLLPVLERLEYIEEELIDALMYIEWLKSGLARGEAHEQTAKISSATIPE